MSVQPPAANSTPNTRSSLPTGEPVVFDTFTGCFQAAPAGEGHPVLMLSPFGYEELCGRTFWTALADRLALAGMASLRFDFPGTANALDGAPEGLDDWRAAALAAADALRRRTGQARIAVLGQGLGATLALRWAPDLGQVAATVLLEPAVSGRAYLRGLKAWGATIAAASGLAADAAALSGHAVAGFRVPETRTAAIGALDLKQVEAPPSPAVLVLEQPGGSAGKLLASRFGAGGIEVTRCDFAGYAELNSDPTSARVPDEAVSTVVDWLAARRPAPDQDAAYPVSTLDAGPSSLHGDGFVERPIRFGAGRGLAGVLCLPESEGARHSAVVLVSAGRDHSIGWARSTVRQARDLARQGVATLRFDVSGIGDSRPGSDAPAEILYSDRMCDDVRAAVDHLDALGYTSLGLVGRCSGAWAAFTVAAGDARIRRVALVNPGYFLWDGSKNLADVIRFAQRNMGDLGTTLLRRNGLRRLLKGQLDWRGAVRFVLRLISRRLLRGCAPLLGRLTAESRHYHDLHGLLARLRGRDVPVLLAYSEADSSLDELRSFMGRELKGLRRYPAMSVREVAGADHNFTPEEARTELLRHLLGFFGSEGLVREGSREAQPEASIPARRLDPYVLVPGRS